MSALGEGPPLAPVHPKRCRNGPETPGFRWAGAACRNTRRSYAATPVHPCTLVAGRRCQRDRQRRHPQSAHARGRDSLSLSPCPLQHAQGFSHCPGLVERHWQAVARRCMHRHCRRPPRSVPPMGHRYLYEAATRTPPLYEPVCAIRRVFHVAAHLYDAGCAAFVGRCAVGCVFMFAVRVQPGSYTAAYTCGTRTQKCAGAALEGEEGQGAKARRGLERRGAKTRPQGSGISGPGFHVRRFPCWAGV